MVNIRELLMACLLLLGSCNIDVADKTKVIQVSKTIEESKAKGVFLAEYKANREFIERAWAEESWLYDTIGNVRKTGFRTLYLKPKFMVYASKDSLNCTAGCNSCGETGGYTTISFSDEDLEKDTLVYSIFTFPQEECLGKLTLIKKK